jgi:hypothetical protein
MASRFSIPLLACAAIVTCATEDSRPDVDGGTNADVEGPNGCFAGSITPAATPSPASRDPDVLARAAAVYGSCGIQDDGIERNLGFMWNEDLEPDLFYFRTARQAACLANARCGCRALEACLGYDLKLGDGGSCEPCTGSVAKFCGEGQFWGTLDCAKVGLTCNPRAVCAPLGAIACDTTTFAPTCDTNGRPQVCIRKGAGGVVFAGPECAKLGLTCAAGRCVGTGATCPFIPRPQPDGVTALPGLGCIGADLDACMAGQHATVRCADRGPGFSCQSFGGQYFCGLASECAPPAEGPSLTAPIGQCEGSRVVICNAGRIDKIDCTTLGFTGCEFNLEEGKSGCVPGTF